MQNAILDIKDIIISRIKNHICIYFIIAWTLINYEVPMILFFSKRSIEKKVEFLNGLSFSPETDFAHPALLTIFIIVIHKFLLLWLQTIINAIQHKTVIMPSKTLIFEHQAEEIKARKKVKKAELMLDSELLRKEIELEQQEKNIQLQKEQEILDKPTILEGIINHIVLLHRMNESHGWNYLQTLKEIEKGPIYRFPPYDHGHPKGYQFSLDVKTYRELNENEKIVIDISDRGTNERRELTLNDSDIYHLNDFITFNLYGRYDASIKIIASNKYTVDMANFTINVQ